MIEQRSFMVMGSTGQVVVVDGAAGLADRARRRLTDLEARWSRFRSDSELARLNDAGGVPCIVSDDTVRLVHAARNAWQLTGGRFDPTVIDSLERLGYCCEWPAIDPPPTASQAVPSKGCGSITAQPASGLVHLPAGTRLDAGGLRKGVALDIVAFELRAAGAAGVLVRLGGNVIVSGAAPAGDSWTIPVPHPEDHRRELATVCLRDGALATTSIGRRQWQTDDGTRLHHLIDPATGLPAHRPWQQVTTIAGSAWWAEVTAVVAYLDHDLAAGAQAALFFDESRRAHLLGGDAALWFSTSELATTSELAS